jgi:anti-sigma regulatory factor (Ser/Thr protein kinase)
LWNSCFFEIDYGDFGKNSCFFGTFSSMTADTGHISVPSGPEALPTLQAFCRSKLESLGQPDLLLTAELVLEEVVLNILEHGYQGDEGPIEVVIEVNSDQVRLTIRDRSPAFDPLQVEHPELQLMERKRGLPLVVQMASSTAYEYTDDGWNVLNVILSATGNADAS